MTSNNEQPRYKGIQILRALAALIVLFYHVGHNVEAEIGKSLVTEFFGWDRWGIAGVLLFFSISGFVISQAAEAAAGPRKFITDRALRIYPGYLLAVGSTIILKLLAYGSFPWGAYSLSSLTLLPLGINDYVLGIEWSLTYEIAFYLVVFIWLVFAPANTIWLLATLWISAILIANFGFTEKGWQATRLTPTLSEVAFSGYCIPFCAGLICHRFRGLLSFITWPGTLAAGAFYGVYALSTSTIVSILALTFGGCILIMVMVNAFRNRGNSSLSSSLMWFGDRSYGVYLVHAPLISTITIAFLKRLNPDPTIASIALILFSIAGAAAYASMELTLYKRLRSALRNRTS